MNTTEVEIHEGIINEAKTSKRIENKPRPNWLPTKGSFRNKELIEGYDKPNIDELLLFINDNSIRFVLYELNCSLAEPCFYIGGYMFYAKINRETKRVIISDNSKFDPFIEVSLIDFANCAVYQVDWREAQDGPYAKVSVNDNDIFYCSDDTDWPYGEDTQWAWA